MPCGSGVHRRARLRHDQGLDGRDHFRIRRLAKVATEMSLHILAYNLKRAVAVLGTPVLIAAMRG